jgi:hypothetical protein
MRDDLLEGEEISELQVFGFKHETSFGIILPEKLEGSQN